MDTELIIFIVVLFAAIFFSVARRKLTSTGAAVASLIAIAIYAGSGFAGIAFLGAFFIMGIAATSWNRKKQKIFFRKESEQRDALQVIANGGIAGILGLLILLFPDLETILILMMACAFSSATADTVSSELGMIYGKASFNILTWRRDIKGENGVVSFEGTLLGIVGSMAIAVIYSILTEPWLLPFFIIVISGTAGNLADSFLGATLERKNIIGNNAVNFLNTFIAAVTGGVLSY
jgi:uncharacterized protein (TIGR00297 family)